MLEGTPDVALDGELHQLVPGDYVAFAAGTGISHYLINHGPDEAEYLIVASLCDEDIITYHTK